MQHLINNAQSDTILQVFDSQSTNSKMAKHIVKNIHFKISRNISKISNATADNQFTKLIHKFKI